MQIHSLRLFHSLNFCCNTTSSLLSHHRFTGVKQREKLVFVVSVREGEGEEGWAWGKRDAQKHIIHIFIHGAGYQTGVVA